MAENEKLSNQLRSLQEHLLQLEAGYTEDAVRRDEQITYLQQQLKESRERVQALSAAGDQERDSLSARCARLTRLFLTKESEKRRRRRRRIRGGGK